MLVRDSVSRFPVTTTPDTSVPDALKFMQGEEVRQLPVMNAKGERAALLKATEPMVSEIVDMSEAA